MPPREACHLPQTQQLPSKHAGEVLAEPQPSAAVECSAATILSHCVPYSYQRQRPQPMLWLHAQQGSRSRADDESEEPL